MKAKRYLPLVYFALTVLIVSLALFMAEGSAEIWATDETAGEEEGDLSLPHERDPDFYAMVYAIDKDHTFKPREKIPPEPEPEPEPEPQPQPAPTPAPDPATPSVPIPTPSGGQSAPQSEEQSGWQSTPSGNTSILTTTELQMFNLVNRARSEAGLPPLKIDNQLVHAARAKSKDMIDNNYFSHTSPVYGGLNGLLRHFGISYRSAGENLAYNSTGVSFAHSSLMASPGHRGNILGANYNLVGIGIQTRRDGAIFYTQLFIGR